MAAAAAILFSRIGTMLEQQIINALTLGSVYALFALGFTLIFGVLQVINLSHGAVFMVGSYVALVIVNQFQAPLWVGMLGAMLVCGLLGLLIDVLVLKPCLLYTSRCV